MLARKESAAGQFLVRLALGVSVSQHASSAGTVSQHAS
jgi:hypothetical protein